MASPALLLTQCLQNDFVQPIGRYEPIPNRLHVGAAEARRLLGDDPADGPVARVMRWAHTTSDDALRLIHIRDWHDPDDPAQHTHLEHFGAHCLHDTPGAAFAFPTEVADEKRVEVIDSLTLNDFSGTRLAAVLAPHAGTPTRVGLIGVWTEAKVSFLAYELVTRYPEFELAVCSALCASSSRQHHFQALDALERLLGVRVIDSVGDFVAFLGGADADVPLPVPAAHPRVTVTAGALDEDDLALVRYLFRDCRDVALTPLDGGFSGNVVAAAVSHDLHGHEQVPHVVKIGPRGPMGQERTAFERIQEVLGNNAPHISDFADAADRGGIKYRYASMGGGAVRTFQKAYQQGLPLPEVAQVLQAVFGEQLNRLYQAATREACDLLDYYQFDPRWAGSVREKVAALVDDADGDTLTLAPGLTTPNVCRFYEETLAHLPRRPGDQSWFSFVHGDLNGANIILDGHGNLWLIDFFHTHRGHVLKDLIKFENDLLYIWTPVADAAALGEATRLTDALVDVADLGVAPTPPAGAPLPEPFARAWNTATMLRNFYPPLVHADRDPFQLWVAQLRYAVHTLGFDESSDWQKRWALYTAGRTAAKITDALTRTTALRLDWFDRDLTGPGRFACTLLPGRQDYGRDLDADLRVLQDAGVTHVCCLVPGDELAHYGVPDLLDRYAAAGIAVHHLGIVDQRVSSVADMQAAVRWCDDALRAGGTVVAHCVGGLGRTGMLAACWLRTRGQDAGTALATVRRVRSPRAVETPAQEAFIASYPA